jgi:two-component system, cell cycle response regulator DivK
MSEQRILVVEDNEKNMKLFRDVLQAKGYLTLEAGSGEQAVELATEHVPDLILMDVQLPGIDGIEALGRIRADERTQAIPVVALTAQAMSGDREHFLESGFDGYISKPVDVMEFIQTVANYLEGDDG